jgi:hypothetical protein
MTKIPYSVTILTFERERAFDAFQARARAIIEEQTGDSVYG